MQSKRPNVIYILTDDQRGEMLGCADHPVLRTPNLDRLVGDGVRFTNAFCTSPACTPSRTSHYLGQWERRHGVNFDSHTAVSAEAFDNAFPMALKRAGYFTGWVGKNHMPVGEGGYDSGVIEQAFDYWYGNRGHSGFYPKERPAGYLYANAAHDTQPEVIEQGAVNFLDPDDDFLARCPGPLPWRPQDQPFCLCLTFNLPHANSTNGMEQRPDDDDLYCSAYREHMSDIPLPNTYQLAGDVMPERLPRSVYNGRPVPSYDYAKTPEGLREHIVRECQTITGVDRFMGRLRSKLEELGLAEDTIIVFSTDHGIHFGEHGLRGKSFLYEQDLRIPLIIYDPRLPNHCRGLVRDELVTVPDLAPTVLQLCGVQVPSSMQGTSLQPLLQGGEGGGPTWRDAIFAEQLMDIQNYPRNECLRTASWKYIRYFPRHPDPNHPQNGTTDNYLRFLTDSAHGLIEPIYEELFDLTADPEERINLAGDNDCASRLQQMRQRLTDSARALLPAWPPNVSPDTVGQTPI